MTWKSHCIANVALAWALTSHLEVAAAAMVTATLPDQLEALLPFGRHRGASHWLAVWLGAVLAVPFYTRREWTVHFARTFAHTMHGWQAGSLLVGTLAFGLALGPFLHVLLDGCSDSGVPVGPFSSRKLKLGLYRTYNFRWRWDFSELLFLSVVVVGCALFWKLHH